METSTMIIGLASQVAIMGAAYVIFIKKPLAVSSEEEEYEDDFEDVVDFEDEDELELDEEDIEYGGNKNIEFLGGVSNLDGEDVEEVEQEIEENFLEDENEEFEDENNEEDIDEFEFDFEEEEDLVKKNKKKKKARQKKKNRKSLFNKRNKNKNVKKVVQEEEDYYLEDEHIEEEEEVSKKDKKTTKEKVVEEIVTEDEMMEMLHSSMEEEDEDNTTEETVEVEEEYIIEHESISDEETDDKEDEVVKMEVQDKVIITGDELEGMALQVEDPLEIHDVEKGFIPRIIMKKKEVPLIIEKEYPTILSKLQDGEILLYPYQIVKEQYDTIREIKPNNGSYQLTPGKHYISFGLKLSGPSNGVYKPYITNYLKYSGFSISMNRYMNSGEVLMIEVEVTKDAVLFENAAMGTLMVY